MESQKSMVLYRLIRYIREKVASINKESVREEIERIQKEFDQLSAGSR